jgi:hypothetical protein
MSFREPLTEQPWSETFWKIYTLFAKASFLRSLRLVNPAGRYRMSWITRQCFLFVAPEIHTLGCGITNYISLDKLSQRIAACSHLFPLKERWSCGGLGVARGQVWDFDRHCICVASLGPYASNSSLPLQIPSTALVKYVLMSSTSQQHHSVQVINVARDIANSVQRMIEYPPVLDPLKVPVKTIIAILECMLVIIIYPLQAT